MSVNLPASQVTVAILAGGQGSRMHGQDKGLLEIQGQRLIDIICQAVKAQTNQIVISANRNLGAYRQTGFPVIPDKMPGFQGPLAGILSVMQSVETPWILTLPCDGPQVNADYLTAMIAACDQSTARPVVASDGEHLQPVHALLPVSLATDLAGYLESGQRKTGLWLSRHAYTRVTFDQPSGFFANLNTPQDLQKLA